MNQTLTLKENEHDDLWFELPDELLDTLGWEDGTVLQWTVIGDSIRISRAPEETLGEAILPGQSRVVRGVSGVSESDGGLQQDDGDVVGEPSY
jgi:hypothetical protein